MCYLNYTYSFYSTFDEAKEEVTRLNAVKYHTNLVWAYSPVRNERSLYTITHLHASLNHESVNRTEKPYYVIFSRQYTSCRIKCLFHWLFYHATRDKWQRFIEYYDERELYRQQLEEASPGTFIYRQTKDVVDTLTYRINSVIAAFLRDTEQEHISPDEYDCAEDVKELRKILNIDAPQKKGLVGILYKRFFSEREREREMTL